MALNMKVKPQHLADFAVQVIEQSVVLPGLINRDTLDDFKGKSDDTITTRVPGYLPAHEIDNWRAERSSPLQIDVYNERKITLTLGGNTYTATKLQDEQKDFDQFQWENVVGVQAEAIARKLEDKAATLVTTDTPYMVTVGGAVAARTGGMRADMVYLRKVANKCLMPREGRVFVIGSGIEEALLTDEKIVLSQNTSESTAEGALREARIGRLMGFDVVSLPDLPDDFGVLFVRDAFVMRTAVPSVPDSVPFGATSTSKRRDGGAAGGGFGVRWMRDYDSTILSERSILNLYNATQYVTDVLYDKTNNRVASADADSAPYEYVIRAIAFDLDATSDDLPVGSVTGDYNDTFARITGIGTQA